MEGTAPPPPAAQPLGFEGPPRGPSHGPPPQGQFNAPPPTYQAVAGTPISKIDFPPQLLSGAGMFSNPEFERFEVLMQRANQWLMQNTQFFVIHVEGMESKARHGHSFADTESSSYLEYGDRYCIYTRSLRLWVRSRGGSDPPTPQQLAYFNVIPMCLSTGGFFSSPEFEPFNVTIDKINQHFRQNPIQGRILTLETEEIKMSQWHGSVDPDKTSWSMYGDRPVFYVMVIRIFYELGPPAMEDIGCADFVPGVVDVGGFLSMPRAEPMSVVAARAHEWIRQQNGIKMTNVQSIDYKVHRGWGGDTALNTMRSCYHQRGSGSTLFTRIMRVCYTRSLSGAPIPPAPFLTYRTFTAPCLGTGGMFSMPTFANQSSMVDTANAWLRATGAKVISAETVPIRLRSGGQYGDPEVTMTYDNADRNEVIVFVIRVFLDGVYQDPPPSALPPPPVMYTNNDQDCCTIL